MFLTRFDCQDRVGSLQPRCRTAWLTSHGYCGRQYPPGCVPESLEREQRDVSFYAHCLEFTGMAWPMVSAESRASIVESLICVIPVVVTPNGAAPPDPDVLRAALREQLNQGANAGELDEDELRALTWMAGHRGR